MTGKNPRLLDLFCGEGGAARGYAEAGFDVFGIDNSQDRLAHYPYDCDSADALRYLLAHGHEFDVIHASPPCTGYSQGTVAVPARLTRYVRLIAATRRALQIVGKPYLIENVQGAEGEMKYPILLCGRMFGLHTHDTDGTLLVLDRHRLFESNLTIRAPKHPVHHRTKIQVAGAYSGARRDKKEAKVERAGGYTPHPTIAGQLLGIDWMSAPGLRLAIPPAYTAHLGRQVRRLIEQ